MTIALQGTLQLSHLHIHTHLNVLFHISTQDAQSHLLASAAYSLPNITDPSVSTDGTKVVRTEPLSFRFNVGWIDGNVLPGMVGRPVLGVVDHGLGFTLFSFFALAASAGLGAMAMMILERRKGRHMKGLPPIGVKGLGLNGSPGYGSYGGYNYGPGKKD